MRHNVLATTFWTVAPAGLRPGIVRANIAIIPLAIGGQVSVQGDMPSTSTDFFLDVHGYFQP